VTALLARLFHRSPVEAEPEVPDLIPEGWFLLETRWDCSYCHGVQPAVVGDNSFRCLRCGNDVAALTD
jgi:hypothetical protein